MSLQHPLHSADSWLFPLGHLFFVFGFFGFCLAVVFPYW